jgi:amidase
MPRRELLDLDATAQLAALASKQVSAVELLKTALGRHEQTHAGLNAVVAADLDRALERAKAIDEQRAKGEQLGMLAGLPMTVKDTLDVAGLPASSGLKAYRRRHAEDATAVGHARRAGAVIWGKTNTPVLAGDWQTFNDLYGTTNNPWDRSRTPGGSSGGAAAALAAQVTALEIGSDIGGSLRVPAAFCGVFAHKPTWGMVTQHGHVPPRPESRVERDLNVLGPMARSARDLRLLLSVLENGPLAAKASPANLAETRIGLWLDAPGFPLDPEVRSVIEGLAEALAAAGAVVEPIRSPVEPETLLRTYVTLLSAVSGEDLPPRQRRLYEMLRGPAKLALGLGAEPLSWASLALGYTARHREWLAADAVRGRLRHEMGSVFQRFDVILAPVAPVAAFPHDHRPFARRRLSSSDGAAFPYISLLSWIALASACRLPATAVPAGFTARGLPVGAQLIGPHGGDGKTLSVAQAIDENIHGFAVPPEAGVLRSPG